MNKDNIIALVDAECAKRRIDMPTQINIDVYTRQEAFENDIDDDSFIYSDGRPIAFYIAFSDHPDYCLIFSDYNDADAEKWISKWFDEIGIK